MIDSQQDNLILMNSRFGGTNYDVLNDVKFGKDGNVYFIGTTTSSNLPTSGKSTLKHY